MAANNMETGMSKIDMVGRITRLLVTAFVVSVGLGTFIIQTHAGGMPRLFWKESVCCGSTDQSTAGSACNCPHCREANSSDSPLRRFFKSHRTKWSERPPKNSWKYYHPCPPYFQPTFGVFQTSWDILPHDECQIPFATPLVYKDDPSPPLAIMSTRLEPIYDVPARPSSEAMVPSPGLEFDEQTPDSVFASQDQPFFATQRAVPRLK